MQQTSPVPPDDVRRHLGEILASEPFRKASRSRRFLQFVTEETLRGRSERIKEYVVGLEVFDKPETFDPKCDSVVRVEARRLRSKLIEFYETPLGRQSAIRIELPKGSYVPEFRSESRQPEQARSWQPPLKAAGLAILGTALLGMAAAAFRILPAPRPTIAVLPFENLSPNPDNAHLCDGLVEELTSALANNPGLRVIARKSAAASRKGEKLSSIASRLRATFLVEGSIRESNGRLRIAAQLIDASDESHVWSEVYEHDPSAVFSLHEKIARSLAKAMEAHSPARPGRPASSPPADSPAADLYWRGRYARKQPGVDSLERSVELYRQALARDPRYAKAHAALAEAYGTMAFHGVEPPAVLIGKSKAAARRALELDPRLAEPQALLAWISFFHDWNWPEAERGFRRAIEVNPNYAKAHTWFALGLVSRGRFREAIAESRIAQELDPLTYAASSDMGVILYCAKRWDEAAAWARKTLASEPGFSPARMLLGMCHSAQGRHEEAIGNFQAALAEGPRYAYMLGRLGHALASAGKGEEARRIIGELDSAGEGGNNHHQIAMVHAGLREPDRAVARLDKALQHHQADVNFLLVEPAFDSIRANPGFQAFLARTGLSRQ